MSHPLILEKLFSTLTSIQRFHNHDSYLYNLLELIAKEEIEKLFKNDSCLPVNFEPFGKIVFPYVEMGKINTLHLFGLDELILFSFYWTNKTNYKKTLDIGANLGLHSIIMDKCGFKVTSFEPDPKHFSLLQRNLNLNNSKNVSPKEAAVSIKNGSVEFVRVLDNTTSSHIAGSKEAYGKLETFTVNTLSFLEIIQDVDLLKMDVEGHENTLLLSTNTNCWLRLDAIVEVGNKENAIEIFNHFKKIKVNLFAQKVGWGLVESVESMPHSYKEGSLFISTKPNMPWGNV